MNIMPRTYLTLRSYILLDILQRHMYKVVNGHLQCRHMYIRLPAIVRISEPLNVLLPLLSIYRYRYTTMEMLTSTQALSGSCMFIKTGVSSSISFWGETMGFIFFIIFVKRRVPFFNRIPKVLADLKENKMSSLDFSLRNFVFDSCIFK